MTNPTMRCHPCGHSQSLITRILDYTLSTEDGQQLLSRLASEHKPMHELVVAGAQLRDVVVPDSTITDYAQNFLGSWWPFLTVDRQETARRAIINACEMANARRAKVLTRWHACLPDLPSNYYFLVEDFGDIVLIEHFTPIVPKDAEIPKERHEDARSVLIADEPYTRLATSDRKNRGLNNETPRSLTLPRPSLAVFID